MGRENILAHFHVKVVVKYFFAKTLYLNCHVKPCVRHLFITALEIPHCVSG